MTERRPVPVINHMRWRWYRLPCRDCGGLFPTAARAGTVPDRCPDCRAAAVEAVEPVPVVEPVVALRRYRTPVEVGMDWMERANCLGCDPDLFYPERGESITQARAVCAGCVVRAECLEFALSTGEKLGIWGGLSERERRRLRRQRAHGDRGVSA